MTTGTRGRRGLTGLLLGASLWAGLAVGAPTGASALGELTQLGVPSRACIWSGSLGECASGLVSGDLTTGVAVSPDGKYTYVVSAGGYTAGTLAVLKRNTTDGSLQQIGCLNADGSGNCIPTPGLNASRSVTVSPDGKSVYVAASTLVTLGRDTKTGLLTFHGCLDDSSTECGDSAALSDVAVSADNKSIFTVTSFGELSIYKRNTTTGDPTFASCFFAGSNSIGCDSVGEGLEEASGVAVSPDNKSVYVSGMRLTTFQRNPSTQEVTLPAVLAQEAPCLSHTHPDCPLGQLNGFAAASRVVVSRDNKSVYATWSVDGQVSHFKRNTTTGALTSAGCVAYNDSPDVCSIAPGLRGAYGIAISRDNKSVYVAGRDDDAIVDLARNTTTGLLSQKDCVARENPNCDDAAQTLDPFGVAVSPDGKSVYATSPTHHAVAEFRRTTSGTATGHLAQLDRPATGCLTADVELRLICTPVATLEAPVGIAISKDGRSAYVGRGSTDGGGLELFKRSPTTGVLTDQGCLRAVATSVCGGGSPLLASGYHGAVISPDNKSVYVTAGDRGIAILKRNTTTGALSDSGCIARTAADGCTVDPELRSADHLVVSADSKSVYVTSFIGGVLSFKRNTTTGALTPNGCLRGPAAPVTTCTLSSTVDFPRTLAVTADGKSVYVLMDHLVREYNRNTSTGVLSHAGCIGTGTGCVSARTLQDPEAIAISPDNKSVYVSNRGSTPGTSQGIAILRRSTAGILSQPAGPPGCIEQDRANDCTADNVYFVPELVVSPDNKSLYVDQRFGPLAIYSRSTAAATLGQIKKLPDAAGCVSTYNPYCTQAIGLEYMGGLAISANNKNVYTTSYISGRGIVDVFSRKLTVTPPPPPAD